MNRYFTNIPSLCAADLSDRTKEISFKRNERIVLYQGDGVTPDMPLYLLPEPNDYAEITEDEFEAFENDPDHWHQTRVIYVPGCYRGVHDFRCILNHDYPGNAGHEPCIRDCADCGTCELHGVPNRGCKRCYMYAANDTNRADLSSDSRFISGSSPNNSPRFLRTVTFLLYYCVFEWCAKTLT